MRKTVMIFGISSFVGSNLAEALKDEFRIVGTYHKNPVSIPGVTCYPCDVLRKDYVGRLLAIVKPDFTIYAVGLSSLTECKLKPKLADALNSAGAANVCASSERVRSKFVLLSSGFVHSGDNILFSEGDTPFPSTVYGTSLSSTEFFVQRSCLNYLILRCGILYGRSFSTTHGNWFEYMERAMTRAEKFTADDSVKSGFLDVHIVANILKKALNENVTNRLLHLSSADIMSRYQFARNYAKVFRLDESLVQGKMIAFPAERKGKEGQEYNFRLSTSNMEQFLGTKMPSIEESLSFTLSRFDPLSAKSS